MRNGGCGWGRMGNGEWRTENGELSDYRTAVLDWNWLGCCASKQFQPNTAARVGWEMDGCIVVLDGTWMDA